MGSVIGGMFTAGTLDEYTRWVLSLTQRGVLRELDPALSTAGVLRAERVLARMVELTGDRRIEDLPIRFTAVAVDLLASRRTPPRARWPGTASPHTHLTCSSPWRGTPVEPSTSTRQQCSSTSGRNLAGEALDQAQLDDV